MVPRFPLNGPVRSPDYKILPTIPKFKIKEPMVITWSSNHTAIYHVLHLRLARAIDRSLAIGLTKMDWKVISMHLGHQFNSYNLMHIQDS
jgi:hypothetical protein